MTVYGAEESGSNSNSTRAITTVTGEDVHMTVSIGVAQYRPREDMKAFVNRADQLMYQQRKAARTGLLES